MVGVRHDADRRPEVRDVGQRARAEHGNADRPGRARPARGSHRRRGRSDAATCRRDAQSVVRHEGRRHRRQVGGRIDGRHEAVALRSCSRRRARAGLDAADIRRHRAAPRRQRGQRQRGVGQRLGQHDPPHGRRRRDVDSDSRTRRRPIASTFATSTRSATATAYVLSIGAGPLSRIYKTTDAGATWTLQFTNADAEAFFDAMAFWDADHGIAVSDSVKGAFVIITTEDGGRTWTRVPAESLPPALPNEGAFAASGTNVTVFGTRHVWFGTGAAARARVLRIGRSRPHLADRGDAAGRPASRAASIRSRFATRIHGVVVGGDYSKETEAVDNAAVTSDGGRTWTLVNGLARISIGRRVRARAARRRSSRSARRDAMCRRDDGRTWTAVDGPGFDTFSFVPGHDHGLGRRRARDDRALSTAWSGSRPARQRREQRLGIFLEENDQRVDPERGAEREVCDEADQRARTMPTIRAQRLQLAAGPMPVDRGRAPRACRRTA